MNVEIKLQILCVENVYFKFAKKKKSIGVLNKKSDYIPCIYLLMYVCL